MKRFFAVVMCALLMVSMCGCAALTDLFVGVSDSEWTLIGMTDNGVEYDETFLSQSGVTGSITFDKETFTMDLQGNSFDGSYVLSSGQLTMTIGEDVLESTLHDDIITMHIDGATLFFAEK